MIRPRVEDQLKPLVKKNFDNFRLRRFDGSHQGRPTVGTLRVDIRLSLYECNHTLRLYLKRRRSIMLFDVKKRLLCNMQNKTLFYSPHLPSVTCMMQSCPLEVVYSVNVSSNIRTKPLLNILLVSNQTSYSFASSVLMNSTCPSALATMSGVLL